MTGDWLLWAGAAAVFVALFLLLANLGIGGSRQRAATQERLGTGMVGQRKGLGSLWTGLSAFAGRRVAAGGAEQALTTRLENAGLATLPGEYVAATAGLAGLAALIGLALAGLLGAILLVVAALAGSHLWLTWRVERRRSAFDDQLPAALQLVAGSLRAGHGLLQACDSVSHEMEAPISEEFQRLVRETRMGRSIYDALKAMSKRVENEDFAWVVEAIAIHREVGGDLAQVIDNVGGTIRERNRLRRRVKSLSADGRLSATILFLLPLLMTALLRVINPSYFDELTNTTVGQVMMIVGVGLLLAGGVWLRRLARVRF